VWEEFVTISDIPVNKVDRFPVQVFIEEAIVNSDLVPCFEKNIGKNSPQVSRSSRDQDLHHQLLLSPIRPAVY